MNESCVDALCAMPSHKEKACLGMEDAMLSVGDDKGVFTGTKGSAGKPLKLVRDPDYPIRCTLQFYKLTDTAQVADAVFQAMAAKIDAVYKTGLAVGSLVTAGQTGRATEPVLNTAKAMDQTMAGIANASNAPLFAGLSAGNSA